MSRRKRVSFDTSHGNVSFYARESTPFIPPRKAKIETLGQTIGRKRKR